MRDHVSDVCDGQKAMSGGSSETDVSEFTIRPAGSPAGAAVTKAIPVVNLERAFRKVRAFGGVAAGWRLWVGLGLGPR
jgi:hypothetical protein